jgi:hypothetical protein
MRRAVIFDVENSSRVEHITRMLEHLELGKLDRETRVMAVGNWGVIGQETAKLLARHGAELLHTAPAFGVKDWSDLRIAVGAGIWLGEACPGDVLEIITDDQAFDAVGDVAAGRGVVFRRLSYRTLVAGRKIAPVEPRRRAGSRRRGRPQRRRTATPVVARTAPGEDAHAAPRDDLLAVVHELVAASGGRSITIDALSNALKARGFSRPPGSPRLITRLRQMKTLDVSPRGTIRLV